MNLLTSLELLLWRMEELKNLLRFLLSEWRVNDTDDALALFERGVELFMVCTGAVATAVSLPDADALNKVIAPTEESLAVVEEVFAKADAKMPLFLDEVTVFNEGLLQKISQLRRTFSDLRKNTDKAKEMDWEEIVFVFEEVDATLNYLEELSKLLINRAV